MKTRLLLRVTMIVFIMLVPWQGYAALSGTMPEPDGNALPLAKVRTVDLPDGVSAGWWVVVQEDIRRSEYKMTWHNKASLPDIKGAYQSPNRAHNLRTYFTSNGIRVIPMTAGEPKWNWGLSLTGYGYKGQVQPVSSAKLSTTGNRIEYQREGLTEWYVNDERGLEQGFTLNRAPVPGFQLPDSSPEIDNHQSSTLKRQSEIFLEILLTGNVTPHINETVTAIEFTSPEGVRAIDYSELHVYDAGGKELQASFSLRELKPGLQNHQSSIIIAFDPTNATYPITIDPLATSPSWTDEGDMNNAYFGYSVATAGDVDGDGCDDVIVSAPWYDMGEPDMGRIYVYHGSLWGLWDSPHWTARGIFGSSVATAGDINNDGYADIIISSGSSVYVYHGSDAGLGEDGTPANADWTATYGKTVGTAGDVNGDGYDDIIIGDPYYSNSEYFEGGAFVYYGSATGLGDPGTPENADWRQESNQVYGYFGYSVGTAGDVNGDGYGDVIVGAPALYDTSGWEQGQTFVYHGSATGLSSSFSWNAISGIAPNKNDFGYSVGSAGDVNGDGYGDIIIGNPFVDDSSRAGQVFVYHGSLTGLDLNGTRPVGYELNADWHVQSSNTDDRFAWSVAGAGDVDGDLYDDVIIGAPYWPDYNRYGMAYLYRGLSTGLDTDYSWYAYGDWSGRPEFGSCVAAAGDVNGDGYDDVIIGAPKYGSLDTGQASVYRGSRFKPPEITTNNARGVTTDAATLRGRLDDLGSASSAQVFFEWGSATVGEVLATYGVGSRPKALAFDGENLWVANWASNNLMKLRASDGELLGTYPTGIAPKALAFDGANIWVAHAWHENNALRKYRASDGELLGTYPVGNYCYDLVFDGTNIWVTNGGSDNTVMKLRASDGKLLGTYEVGDYPIALAFDGTYIWVANLNSDNLMRLRANSGELVATYDVGDSPWDLAIETGRNIFEGNIWVANSRDNTIMKLNTYSGEHLATYHYGLAPSSLAFDGAHIWVGAYENVMKLRASDGMLLGTYPLGTESKTVAFDGTDIWVANYDSNNVMRLKASPYEYRTPAQTQTGAGIFDATINGLDPATIYHFRARAVGDGDGFGADMTFTYTPGPPVVATASATDVTSDTALLNGILYYLGEVGSADVSFEWGFDSGYGNETPLEEMSSTGSFSAMISGLVPGSTYHFRAKGVGDGIGYGDDMTFVAQADEVWVDDDYTAGGFNDGHTWGIDAFNTIQEGIDIVASPGTVRVAPGRYNETITLRSGVKILGAGAGFDPALHAIIDGSDLWEAAVVTARNIDSTATLDGLTIANGDGDPFLGSGGGMFNYQSSPTVSNCIFFGNEVGLYYGGSGGGIYNHNSSPTVINCIFSDNKAWGDGGGMFNYQSTPTVINCTFSGNEATNSGGGVCNSVSEATITNTILWGNSAYQENEVYNSSCSPVITYCDIQQPSGTYPGTGNINVAPLFVDSGIGDFHLQANSPCIDTGSNSAVPPEIITDFEGDGRIIDGDDIHGAIVDMGADEYVPAGTECQGDFEPDGDVDGSDLAVFAADFGRTDCGAGEDCEGDFDGDGDVDGSDLAVFAADFGRTDCPN